mgnify:CR=1 FL=1
MISLVAEGPDAAYQSTSSAGGGASTSFQVTAGILNLTHRTSHEAPEPLEPGVVTGRFQEAVEAPNINSFQMRASFGQHEIQPGRLLLQEDTPPWVRDELRSMGYTLVFEERTSGPIKPIDTVCGDK